MIESGRRRVWREKGVENSLLSGARAAFVDGCTHGGNRVGDVLSGVDKAQSSMGWLLRRPVMANLFVIILMWAANTSWRREVM
jgi:hypothetical protein